MERIPRVFRKLKLRILDAGIITKMTAVYILAVLVPSVSMAVYSYRESVRLTEQETLSDAITVFAELHDQLVERIQDATYLADQIAYNSRLRIFMSNRYEFRADNVLRYRDVVFPIVEYASVFQGAGIAGVRLFFVNDSIPEYWPYFYRQSRAANLPWFAEFAASKEESGWFYPSDSAIQSEFLDLESEVVFTYARKMFSQTVRYIGTATVDVDEDYIFGTFAHFAGENLQFILLSKTKGVVYATNGAGDPELPKASAFSLDGHTVIRRGGRAYIGRALPFMDYTMISIADLRGEARKTNPTRYLTPIVIIVSVGILEVISYLALTGLLARMQRISETMNRAADGDFHTRIPVHSHDEIGQIAEDYNIMIAKINDLVTETVERETTQKDAQLRALQLQINPHFIYNTIDTFRMRLVLERNFELADNLASFGKMLRYNMSESNLYTTLSEELDYVKKYLTIQALRYSDRISLSDEVSPDHRGVMVLKFVLQPIVENSITHGVVGSEQRIAIRISSREMNGRLAISVEDDGAGIDPGQLREIRQRLRVGSTESDDRQIGLSNINRRLKLYYGQLAGLEVESTPGSGTCVTITVPLEEEGAT